MYCSLNLSYSTGLLIQVYYSIKTPFPLNAILQLLLIYDAAFIVKGHDVAFVTHIKGFSVFLPPLTGHKGFCVGMGEGRGGWRVP